MLTEIHTNPVFPVSLNMQTVSNIDVTNVSFSAKAIDEYASLRNKAAESKDAGDIDPRLEAIVERMLDKYEGS